VEEGESDLFAGDRYFFFRHLGDIQPPSVADCKIRTLLPSWATMGSHSAFLCSPAAGQAEPGSRETFFPAAVSMGREASHCSPCIFYAKLHKK
jgi:hypothetical protein